MAKADGDGARSPAGARAIERRPVDALIPYAQNARTHSDAQVALIAGSIREFGFNNPVLVDGASGIIAGHGRVLAARKLGLAEVPVIELGHLSAAQKRAYILADNRLAEQAGWDRELLGAGAGRSGRARRRPRRDRLRRGRARRAAEPCRGRPERGGDARTPGRSGQPAGRSVACSGITGCSAATRRRPTTWPACWTGCSPT